MDSFSINLIEINYVANSLGRFLDIAFVSQDFQYSIMENTPLISNSVHHNLLRFVLKIISLIIFLNLINLKLS